MLKGRCELYGKLCCCFGDHIYYSEYLVSIQNNNVLYYSEYLVSIQNNKVQCYG